MLSALSQMKGVTEIRDANGNPVGLFTPSNLAEEKELYEKAKRLFDPVELKRRKLDEGGMGSSHDDVWTRIHAKESNL